MNAVYLIDGKPHRICDCNTMSPACPKGRLRTLQTCGFSQCLVPAPDVILMEGSGTFNASRSESRSTNAPGTTCEGMRNIETVATPSAERAQEPAVAWGPEKQDYPGGPVYRIGSSTGATVPQTGCAGDVRNAPTSSVRVQQGVTPRVDDWLDRNFPRDREATRRAAEDQYYHCLVLARQLERELTEANERLSYMASAAAVERGAVVLDDAHWRYKFHDRAAFEAFAISEGFTRSAKPPTERELLQLLVDYHDNQASGAEAMGVDGSVKYHDKQRAIFQAMLDKRAIAEGRGA